MSGKIEKRIGRGLEGADREELFKYLDWLREALNSASLIVRRSVTFMLLLMVIFQLIQEQGNSEITLGPLKITQIETILYFIPTLIAYFYLEVIVYTTRYDNLATAFSSTFKKWRDAAEKNDLDDLVTPWLPLYWNVAGTAVYENNEMAYSKIENYASVVLAVGSLVGAIAFEIYAFYQLFNVYSVSAPLLWVNQFITSGLIITAVAHLCMTDKT